MRFPVASAPSLLAALAVSVAAVFVAGCSAGPEDEDPSTGAAASSAAIPVKTMCFSGRSWSSDPYSVGGAADLAALCRGLPGLIVDERDGRDAAYPFFRWDSSTSHELDVLVHALDTDGDGRVTEADAPARLNVVGFSWGGYNARDLVRGIDDDDRFVGERKIVEGFYALDPYRTDALIFRKAQMNVPANLRTFWEFRHTVAPDDDCSRTSLGIVGPFTGRTPYCTGTTVCRDFDYSLSTSTAGVDHCGVPRAASAIVRAAITGAPLPALPREHAVERYEP